MTRNYRGQEKCVFGEGETVGEWCDWNDGMFMKLNGRPSGVPDQFDRVELCKLCTEQSTLRAVSFIGTCLKQAKRA